MREQIKNERVIPNFSVGGTEKPTIHIVHILDGSGSMGGYKGVTKFQSAKEGMTEEVNILSKDNEINYLYTIVEFDESTRIKTICNKIPIKGIKINSLRFFEPDSTTALYDAIGFTLNNLITNTNNEKVLVKIFTDGGENASKTFTKDSVRNLIQECEQKGFVITFVGTDRDVVIVQNNLNIKASNTLGYDGTAQGLKMSYRASNEATVMYSKSVAAGTDSIEGFFSNNNNK